MRLELCALALGVPLLFPLQAALDAHPGQPATVLVTLPPARILPALACGHGGSGASLLEIRTTSYVFANMRPGRLVDDRTVIESYAAICALDPLDAAAVRRGALMLGALCDSPDEALALLDRGLARVPLEHRERANLFWEKAALHLCCFTGAPAEEQARHVRLAGELLIQMAEDPRVPGAGELRSYGDRLRRRGLDEVQALIQEEQIWKERVALGEGRVREAAEERLAETTSARLRAQLQREVDRRAREGHPVAGLAELGTLPADPLGTGFFLREGRVLAPAVEARMLERRLQRALDAWRARGGTGTPSLADLGAAPAPWLHVDLSGEVPRVDVDLGLLEAGGQR